jgi:hypothetical protein
MTGWFAGEGLVVTLLRDPGGFTPETPEVIKLRPANPASTDNLYALYRGGVEGEDTFDTDTGRDFPDHEGLSHTTTTTADADPFEGLDPLFFTFTDAIENSDCIPWSELGDVRANLLSFELSQ